MKNGFLTWQGASDFYYASSLAATWIWAPAMFVAFDKAYYDGLPGFLMFFIPNVLTLILFAFIAEKVRSHISGVTIADAILSSPNRQKKLHLIVSLTVLVCSTCVQLLGMHTILVAFTDSKVISAMIISTAGLLTVGAGGLKASIKTDACKYIIMVICGLILLCSTPGPFSFAGISGKSVSDIWFSFGLTTTIGLLAAPYADQTFWQRVFSLDSKKAKFDFFYSAALFAVVPLAYRPYHRQGGG